MTRGPRQVAMRIRLFGGVVAVASMIARGPAAARDAVDCAPLKTTAIPYELQMRQDDTRTYPVQVYRGNNITRLQYTKVGDHLITSRFQANFQLEYQDLAGVDVRFTYSVPTDRYIWRQESHVVTYNTSISGAAAVGPGFTQVYEMLPDASSPWAIACSRPSTSVSSRPPRKRRRTRKFGSRPS